MSKKEKNIKSPAVKVEGGFRRWLWIALAVVLVIAAAVLTWYLIRYQFNKEYKDYITEPAPAAAGTEFTGIQEETVFAEGYVLVAENETLKLYANPETGFVAVHDLRNGNTVYSNPPEADNDKVANKTNRGYVKSQLMVDYYNASFNTGSFSSWADCVERGKLEVESIPNGVRFIYSMENAVEIYLVPSYLTNERYQYLYENVSDEIKKEMYGNANSFYEQRADGDWYVSENGKKKPIRNKKKMSDAFIELGMTEEEYYDWEEKAGTVIAEALGFTVAVDWTLDGDSVVCSIPPELIDERGGGMLYRIHLMPYMAAAGKDETGYMVVPNGSGSLIHFNNGKQSNAQYSQYVYEMDLVDSDYLRKQNFQPVRLPIFAMCREDSSVLAIIEGGATLANITADVSGRNNSYNNAYALFTIRGDEMMAMFGAGEMDEMPIVEDEYYHETLSVRYTLLTEENKGYSGVANYYRQHLIDQGVLTVKEEGGDIPFYYDVIGGVKETAHTMGIQHLRVKAMTTFEQAGQMAAKLDELGAENQVMNFSGWMNGGYYHDVPNRITVLRQLGGKDDLQDLADTMEQYGQMYVDVALQNVTYISKRYNVNAETSRYYGAGYAVQFGEVNPANLRSTASLGYAENIYNLLSPKFLPYYVGKLVDAVDGYDESIGISLRDLGYQLHADKKRTEVINREEALMIVEGQFDRLQETGRDLMITGGNAYALEGVSHVLNVPMSASEYFIVDDTVPLYQMVLHGCVDYAGKPVNAYVSASHQADLLKKIEYGAAVRYIFTWEESAEMKYTGLNKYYATTFDTWCEQAAADYAYVNGALAQVSDAQMIEHVALTDDLVRVTYSNGVIIYVNYSGEAAQADGHTIEAESYLAVKGGETK